MVERKLYDKVQLKDGNEAIIVDFLGSNAYIVDIGDSTENWDTILIEEKDILSKPST